MTWQLPTTFRALRYRNYRLFFFGQLVSLIGTWMQILAQQWLVYRLTGSAAMLGMVSLVGLVPLIPLVLWGGSLADRFPKRRIILVTQTVMMLQAFLLATLVWTGAVQVWHVMMLAMVLSAAAAVDMPTRQAFIVEMVDRREDLTNAIALNSVVFHAARALGPALAGLGVAAIGEAGAFFLNGISFVAVIGGLLLMRLPVAPPSARRGSLGSHMREGFQYVLSQPTLLVLMSLVAATSFLSMPYTTLMPVFAATVLKESAAPLVGFMCTGEAAILSCQSPDAVTYGFLMAASGLGALTGAIAVASLPSTAPRGRWLTAGTVAFPALLVCMALSRVYAVTLVLLIGIGLSFVVLNTLANTLIQMSTPDGLRGRVMSFYTLVFNSTMRLGSMQAGLVGDLLGAPVSVGIGAVLCLGYNSWVAWRRPQVRSMR